MAAAACALLAGGAIVVNPVVAIGLVVGLTYGLLVLERPIIGVYTCFALVPITAGVRRGLPVPGAKPDEAIVLATFILVAGFAGQTRKWALVDRAFAFFAVAAFVVPIVSAILLDTPLTFLGIQKMGALILFLLLFRLVRLVDLTDDQRWFALKLLFAGTIPVVLVALGQRFNLPGIRDGIESLTEGAVFRQWSYRQGGAANRATGLFESWHSLAGYLFPILLVGVALLTQRDVPAAWRKIAVGVVGITLMGIVAAQTITTLAVAIIAAILVGAIQGRFARTITSLSLIIMLAVAVSGGALTNRISNQFEDSGLGQNIEARLDIWTEDYAEPLGRYWATGYGPEIPADIQWAHTESLYVTLILRGGLLLLTAYFIAMFVVGAAAWDGRASPNPLDRVISTAVFAATIGSLAMHLVFPYLTSSGFPQVFWLLVALVPTRRGAGPLTASQATPGVMHDGQELVGSPR